MTPLIQSLRTMIVEKRHHAYRTGSVADLASDFSARGLSPTLRTAERLVAVLDAERPVILEGERIVLTRSVSVLPPLFTDSEWAKWREGRFVHEQGRVCNISPDYASVIGQGLEAKAEAARGRLERCLREGDAEGAEFLTALLSSIEAVLRLAERYREAALAAGRTEVARALERVPRLGARTLLEAMQSFRFLHFALWCEGEYHNTVGRLDQYLYPYFASDLAAGRLDRASALELVEEFFLSFNRDSDLYPGVQQGDNGQSLVLGGVDRDGADAFNELSRLCLEASRELKLIDPKINLRVHARTKPEVYELGTLLTKEGLGFPQYSNDEVVVPGLVELGYSLEDARNYVVAACWEFIVPGRGMDIPNIAALCFPLAVDRAMRKSLASSDSFEAFLEAVRGEIGGEARRLAESVANLALLPAPFMSVLTEGRIEAARDVSRGARYNNYGIHGTGPLHGRRFPGGHRRADIPPAQAFSERAHPSCRLGFRREARAPARASLRVPETRERRRTHDGLGRRAPRVLRLLPRGPPQRARGRIPGGHRLGHVLPLACPRAGSLAGRKEGGRELRSELFAEHLRESEGPDLGDPILRLARPPRCHQRRRPLTLEFQASLFREEENITKVASLVKTFFDLGGHQLQLNAVDRETLLDAQARPEAHRGLIVRVWGWSAYFVELDSEYQEHVIRRQEYSL